MDPVARDETELDILLSAAIREIDSYTDIDQDLFDTLPISPESLSPGPVSPDPQYKDETPNYKTLMQFFSVLKTNYLKLCNSYNFLLLKLSDCEMDRCKLYEENLELKKLLKYMIDTGSTAKQ